MKPTLFIFAKAPRMGKVKTRLAADVGDVHAWRIYRALTAKILREMQDARWHTILYGMETKYSKVRKAGGQGGLRQGNLRCDFGQLWPSNIPRIEQCDGGLSERTAMLFTGKGSFFNKGSVITIGTDIPAMKRSDIAAGFKALKHNDAVIGPAKDGGFYLIGLNAPADPNLFNGIRWSHPETRTDMCAAIDGRVALLRELEDVDNLAGYLRFRG